MLTKTLALKSCTFFQFFDRDEEMMWWGFILSIQQVEDEEILCSGSMKVSVDVTQKVHVHHFLAAVHSSCQRPPRLAFLKQDKKLRQILPMYVINPKPCSISTLNLHFTDLKIDGKSSSPVSGIVIQSEQIVFVWVSWYTVWIWVGWFCFEMELIYIQVR